MKSFAMLVSLPESGDMDEARYFIDGKRVTQDEYRKLRDNCARQDTFQTYRLGNRWHHYSACYR